VLLVADPRVPHGAVVATRERAPMRVDLVHRGAPCEEFLLRLERLVAAEEQRREIDLLRHAALHDDRTDLLRPKAFQQRLAEHFSAAQRHRLDLVLALIDLDDFGRVNKAFDHTVGDLVISKVGEVIRRTLRTEDVAGRLGGDEFAVLLPYTQKLDGARVVRRLCEEIGALSASLRPVAPELVVAASLGFETFDGRDLDSLETLRLHSELALREAKRQGGGRGVYYRSLRRES
jgi:diguanylate cyclase